MKAYFVRFSTAFIGGQSVEDCIITYKMFQRVDEASFYKKICELYPHCDDIKIINVVKL